ncbi:putative membrane protein [Flexibacter flexilis DSM 6793]|uniref:Putative membrane protein n=1 Tax=Flexibacter flexilis DSM 6793 TaxID=927664 RepID=A0A1I1K7N8_9BACT|nr:bestrophin family ion channel [Flexibacter flexilis]SFC54748.1 putative membrane protein [Flexibacter flexilis DSM 6793]
MIEHNSTTWIEVVKLFFSSKTLHNLTPGVLTAGTYTLALVYLNNNYINDKMIIPSFIYSLMGIVLGLLLVFRTNTSYDRWWEGRRLLGALLNTSRNLALKFNAYLPNEDKENRDFFAKTIINYSYALKEHLRSGVRADEILPLDKTYTTEFLMNTSHVPNRIASIMYQKVNDLYEKKTFTVEQFMMLDKQMEALTDILGGCERIKKSPIPSAYKIHLMKFIFLFIFILPFGFIHEIHYWSVPIVMIIFYAFVGLDFIAGEIEEPFGLDANDLPTDAICTSVRTNVFEIMKHKI